MTKGETPITAAYEQAPNASAEADHASAAAGESTADADADADADAEAGERAERLTGAELFAAAAATAEAQVEVSPEQQPAQLASVEGAAKSAAKAEADAAKKDEDEQAEAVEEVPVDLSMTEAEMFEAITEADGARAAPGADEGEASALFGDGGMRGDGGAFILPILGLAAAAAVIAVAVSHDDDVPDVQPEPENQAPNITSAATANVQENTDANTVVYTAQATDPEGDNITFSLTGDDAGLFTINAATGEVRLIEAADFEARASYNLTVVATDSEGNQDTQQVTLNVTDVPEPPNITSAATAEVQENTDANTVVYTAQATDPEGGNITFSLTGEDAGLFTIDAATGEVRLVEAADFEARASYNFAVVATDPEGNQDTQQVTLNVIDVPEQGQTFTLTAGIDILTGTANDDLFVATMDTYTTGDVLVGNGGEDTLQLTANTVGAGLETVVTTENIEVVEIQNLANASITLNAAQWSGVDEIVATGNQEIIIDELQEEISTVTFRDFGQGRDLEIQVEDTVFAGTDDTLAVNLESAGSIAQLSEADLFVFNETGNDVIETYVVNSVSGEGNYISLNNTAAMRMLTITGGADVLVELSDDSELTEVNASAATADVTLSTLFVNNDFTYTGSQGRDVVVVGDEVEAGTDVDRAISLDAGTGDDLVSVDASALTANDTYAGGEGVDTLALFAGGLDVLSNATTSGFEILQVNGAAAGAVELDASAYERVILSANAGDLTVTGLDAGNTLVLDEFQTSITLAGAGDADVANVAVANETVVVNSFDATGIETLNLSFADADSLLIIGTLNLTGADTLSISGAGDFDLGGSNNAGFLTADLQMVDLSDLTGSFDNEGTNIALNDGADFVIGNVANSYIQINADAAITDQSVFEFGAELDNILTIEGFESGAGGDVLNLGALGVTGIANLNMVAADIDSDGFADDTIITSDAFAGQIGLIDTDAAALQSGENFVFA